MSQVNPFQHGHERLATTGQREIDGAECATWISQSNHRTGDTLFKSHFGKDAGQKKKRQQAALASYPRAQVLPGGCTRILS